MDAFLLFYQVQNKLGFDIEGISTSGSAGFLIDTDNLTQADDTWNGGTAYLFTSGSPGADTGTITTITDFVQSTSKATLKSGETTVTGQAYSLGKKRYPLSWIRKNVNLALDEIGLVPFIDTTSVTIVADTLEYSLPTGAGKDLRQVWIPDDEGFYYELHNWHVEQQAIGSVAKLVFNTQPWEGMKLKLIYVNKHPRLYNATDKVSDMIDKERVVTRAVYNCLMNMRAKESDEELDPLINEAKEQIMRADANAPFTTMPPKSPRYLTLSI
jgi:hypothetical protein